MRPTALHAALLAALCFATAALALVEVPALEARVTDLTGTLDANQRAGLEEKLRAFEARKGSQLAVLIVPTTDPEDIADFGIRVADQWKLGRKGVDDGAILIVAKNDRRMRLEVGYGLEGVLTDAASRRIIDEIIAPRFKLNDFYGGLDAGIDRIIGLIDGEPLPAPEREWSGRVPLADTLPFLIFAVFAAAAVLRRVLGSFGGALGAGAVAGGVAWFLTYALPWTVLWAIVGFGVALVMGGMGGPRRWSSHRRGGRGAGWGGGWGGGTFGGGGGGGFSGGGGGFGGGGASGSW